MHRAIADRSAYALAYVYRVAAAIRTPKRVTDLIRRAYVRAVRHANALYWADPNRLALASTYVDDYPKPYRDYVAYPDALTDDDPTAATDY